MIKDIETSIGIITLAPMTLDDVPYQADYLYNSPKEFLTRIGFDISILPSREEYIQNLCSRIKAQMERGAEDKNYATIVARYDGKPIGIVVLVPSPAPSESHAHFHIWDKSLRGKNLGKEILLNGLKLLMDHQKRSLAYIEPHKNNGPMNKLMRKCGFKFLGDSVFSGPRNSTFESKKYLIERSNI